MFSCRNTRYTTWRFEALLQKCQVHHLAFRGSLAEIPGTPLGVSRLSCRNVRYTTLRFEGLLQKQQVHHLAFRGSLAETLGTRLCVLTSRGSLAEIPCALLSVSKLSSRNTKYTTWRFEVLLQKYQVHHLTSKVLLQKHRVHHLASRGFLAETPGTARSVRGSLAEIPGTAAGVSRLSCRNTRYTT